LIVNSYPTLYYSNICSTLDNNEPPILSYPSDKTNILATGFFYFLFYNIHNPYSIPDDVFVEPVPTIFFMAAFSYGLFSSIFLKKGV